MKTGKKCFNVMVKPVGPICNLDCVYCYYLSKEELLNLSGRKPISDDILEKFIKEYIEGNDVADVIFDWQGGEPTLLGLDFFRKIIEIQKRYCPPDKRVLNNLQTNGTLLDEQWCDFLRDNGFLVGLSIDGPKKYHDKYRKTKRQESAFNKAFDSAKLMKKHGVQFNTLTVVNRMNAKYPLDVYRFLSREVGPRMMQFIPCVEPIGFENTAPLHWDITKMPVVGTTTAKLGTLNSIVTDWTIDPDDFGEFLCKIFDDWYSRDIGKYYVNIFESCVGVWAGMPSQMCVFHDVCGKALVLEKDGGIYSCDHFVYSEFKLGNIKERPLVEAVFSKTQMDFGYAKRRSLPKYCNECKYLFACWGECPKNRFVKTPDGEPGLNYLCQGFKRFFAHTDERFQKLASGLHKNQL